MIEIQAFPASYGESVLVSLGKNENKKNILIDTGFVSTYDNHIKNKLLELKKDKLVIDLLIFTHFDADHISGGIKLLKENVNSKESNIISIKNIWLNRLKHIEFNSNESVNINEKNKKILRKILEKRYPIELFSTTLNDISAEQCLTISQLIDSGGYNSNDKSLVFIENSNKNVYYLNENIEIIILSPTKEKLVKLRRIWVEELIKIGIDQQLDDNEEISEAFEKIMVNIVEKSKKRKLSNCSGSVDIIKEIIDDDVFNEDESDINGSSLAFIIKYNEKRILFLGDSHPSVVENYMKGKLKGKEEKRLKFDLINISHHGSSGNTSAELLKLVDCSKFLICTSGKKFGHPDKETLARIITSNDRKHKEIFLNYKADSLNIFLDEDLKKKYNYSIEITNEARTLNRLCKSTYIKL